MGIKHLTPLRLHAIGISMYECMSNYGTKIRVDDVVYRSIRQACFAYGWKYSHFLHALKIHHVTEYRGREVSFVCKRSEADRMSRKPFAGVLRRHGDPGVAVFIDDVEYGSMKEASEATGITRESISEALKAGRTSLNGKSIAYVDDFAERRRLGMD